MNQVIPLSSFDINCPRQQHINNTVCFWPREKFISTSEDTKYKSGKIKRNKPLCHLPCREEIQKQGGWVGEKLHEAERQCDLFESDKKLKYNIACNIN